MGRFNYNDQASVWRQIRTGNKTALTDTGETVFGFLLPVDADQNTVALGIVDQAYQFTFDGQDDIRPSDVIYIDSVRYNVRGVRNPKMKRHDFKIAIMELSVKE